MVELKNETGCDVKFVNLSGGVGVAYKPDQVPNDIREIGEGVHKAFDELKALEEMTKEKFGE